MISDERKAYHQLLMREGAQLAATVWNAAGDRAFVDVAAVQPLWDAYEMHPDREVQIAMNELAAVYRVTVQNLAAELNRQFPERATMEPPA